MKSKKIFRKLCRSCSATALVLCFGCSATVSDESSSPSEASEDAVSRAQSSLMSTAAPAQSAAMRVASPNSHLVKGMVESAHVGFGGKFNFGGAPPGVAGGLGIAGAPAGGSTGMGGSGGGSSCCDRCDTVCEGRNWVCAEQSCTCDCVGSVDLQIDSSLGSD
jgi:hypothetical protein